MQCRDPLGRRSLCLGIAGVSAGVMAATAAESVLADDKSLAVTPRTPLATRSADGTMLYGDAQGNSDALEILFIHGVRQSRLSWDKQFADPALRGFRLVRFDLRGHGDSDKPSDLNAYADADRSADDVAAVIEAAKLRRPVVVGWSLGGFVIGAYLRKYGGDRLAGVNLVDAVTKLSPALLTAAASDFSRRCTSHDLTERTVASAEFLSACFHQPPTGVELQRMLVVNGMATRAANEGFIKTTTTDLEPVFAAYRGPILLSHGVYDQLVRVGMSERIKAQSPKHSLSIYANSGHSPFYEEPIRYGRELASFTVMANRG